MPACSAVHVSTGHTISPATVSACPDLSNGSVGAHVVLGGAINAGLRLLPVRQTPPHLLLPNVVDALKHLIRRSPLPLPMKICLPTSWYLRLGQAMPCA